MTDRHSLRLTEWRQVRLSEICEPDRHIIDYGSPETASLPYLSLEHIESETGRILRGPAETNSTEGRSTTYAFDTRHVLYGKLRPYLNKVALPTFAGRCTTELIPLLPKGVEREFLAWLLRRPETVSAAMSQKTGSRMPRASLDDLLALDVPFPPAEVRSRIVHDLGLQMATVERARAAAEAQLQLTANLAEQYLYHSLQPSNLPICALEELLIETRQGVGTKWADYPVLGATRAGLAPAKEKVGKNPARYKLADQGTIFYNPMRIMLGSIAMIDENDSPGITSPDYVVLKTRQGLLHHRWFYYWFRSRHGQALVQSLARGAVRERILFNRLASGTLRLPPWEVQTRTAENLKRADKLKKLLTMQLEATNALPAALVREVFSLNGAK
jgi:type I restriction enzyme, S subunit